MGAIASVQESALQVAPGQVATTTLTVRNAGQVVDEFTFEVLGDAAAWTTVEPDLVRLMPGAEEVVVVSMAPPTTADLPPGDLPFGIKVNAKEDPEASVVEEIVVAVGVFSSVVAELVPHTSQGSRVGRHDIAVDNHGNELLGVGLSATDPDDRLTFRLQEPELALEPGTAAFTELEVRPRKRFWRGANKTLPFQVVVDHAGGDEPILLDGSMVQKAILPPWLLRALLALLALLLLLWLLWLFLLRPEMESLAQEAADEAAEEAVAEAVEAASSPVAEVEEELAQQEEAVEEAESEVAAQAEELATQEAVVEDLNERLEAVEGTPAPDPLSESIAEEVRLAVVDAPGGGVSTDSFTVQPGEAYEMTDIILQNPDGNEGTVQVTRGSDTLLVMSLANFRDLDYHFVTPAVFQEGEQLVLSLECGELLEDNTECSTRAYVSGNSIVPTEPES